MKIVPMGTIMNSPFYKLTGDHNCEINGLKMSQNIIAPAAWCLAIMQDRPWAVVEIGTGRGGLSYLMSQALSTYGGKLVTVDIKDELQKELLGNCELGIGDIFEATDKMQELCGKSGTVFILCDGGAKEKEFNTFSKFLKPGDVIGAHDWMDLSKPDCLDYWSWSEVNEFNLDLSGLAPFMPEWFDKSAWFVRQKV